MADAPGHRLGQIIGDALEESVRPVLQAFAREHRLYLDSAGDRPTRGGEKVTWEDDRGNAHVLDFVLERGGTAEKLGTPAAFIEVAWRRYTKHSRAKAQEIQGAVEPLLARFAEVRPFAGAVIAGHWTDGALTQLRSQGFTLLHIEYSEMVAAFAAHGIDIDANESTSDDYLQAQVDAFDQLDRAQRTELGEKLRALAPDEYQGFVESLEETIVRKVTRVIVLPLYGTETAYASIAEATKAIVSHSPGRDVSFERFEISIRFTNGDRIDASFAAGADAVEFLTTFA